MYNLVLHSLEGVNQISPTQYELHYTTFTPTEDPRIFFVDW